jgi:uncharacterized membrane protein
MAEAKETKTLNTGMAVVAYILFFVPLLTEDKNDPFVKYHVKQGLVLFVAAVANMIFAMVPLIGWMLAPLISIGLLILVVVGIINAVNGEQKPLPVIGQYADKISL